MDRLRGKRIPGFFALLCVALILASCGSRETLPPSPSGGTASLSAEGGTLDTVVDDTAFYDASKDLPEGKFLSMQFYLGEPVQLWASGTVRGKDGGRYVSVYLYRRDGTRETCLEQVTRDTGRAIRFLDKDGFAYSVSGNSVTKLHPSGEVVYHASSDDFIMEICQLEDGRIFMMVLPGGSGSDYRLARLEDGGRITPVSLTERAPANISHIGVSPEGLLLMKGDYVYRISLSDGTAQQAVSFRQTSYTVDTNALITAADQVVRAFRLLPDGGLEILKADAAGNGKCESVRFEEVDRDKTPIVLRGLVLENDSWLKEQILKFNSSGGKYFVTVETPEAGADQAAFITATGIGLATGKGADILMGADLLGSADSLIGKGGLVDLAPLMERSGIREEDYFPAAFDFWRTGESIYGVCYKQMVKNQMMRTEVLGGVENPDLKAVVEALLSYREDAFFARGESGRLILRDLLSGSETLGGTVDWDACTCDFRGELFAAVLEAAKRYQYDQTKELPLITDTYQSVNMFGFSLFKTSDEMKKEGYSVSGTLFDDGCHPQLNTDYFVMFLNANSANREGAWEFLEFLLSGEIQNRVYEGRYLPVKRNAFQAEAEREMRNGLLSTMYFDTLTQERVDEVRAFLDDARALPYRTKEVLNIILEESQSYFDGTKDIPQVVDIIQNRVNLYLQERKK